MVKKSDLISATAAKTGISKTDIAVVVDAYLDSVFEAVSAREDVSLGNLGKFKVKKTKPRAGRTMVSGLTGQEVVIPEKGEDYQSTFKVSTKLKDSVALKEGEQI